MNAVLRFNTNVIRDYRGSAKIPGRAVSEAEQNSLRNKVKKLLGQAVKAKTPDADDGERVRLSNELCCRGFDHALQLGANKSLVDFQAQRPLRPLLANEKRYFVMAANLPAAAVQLGQACRACVEDLATGARRLELVVPPSQNILHVRSDTDAALLVRARQACRQHALG